MEANKTLILTQTHKGNTTAKTIDISRTGVITNVKTNHTYAQVGNGSGYMTVGIGGKRRYVHRLVAIAYLPNPKDKEQVNHINGKRDDNRLENLEWVTCSENHLHAFKHLGKKGSCLGKRNGVIPNGKPCRKVYVMSKLSGLISIFPSLHQVSRTLGIGQGNITTMIKKHGMHGGQRKTSKYITWPVKE